MGKSVFMIERFRQDTVYSSQGSQKKSKATLNWRKISFCALPAHGKRGARRFCPADLPNIGVKRTTLKQTELPLPETARETR